MMLRHPPQQPRTSAVSFLLIVAALSAIPQAHAQLEMQTGLITSVLQLSMMNNRFSFASMASDFTDVERRELMENSTWTLLGQRNVLDFCSMDTQQLRRTVIRTASFVVTVAVNLRQVNDSTPPEWRQIFQGGDPENNLTFSECDRGTGVVVMDFKTAKGYEDAETGKALVSQTVAASVGRDTFMNNCFKMRTGTPQNECASGPIRIGRSIKEIKRNKAVPHQDRSTISVTYDLEQFFIELVALIALGLEIGLVSSKLTKKRDLKVWEWGMVVLVTAAVAATASFSAYNTLRTLAPIDMSWATTNVDRAWELGEAQAVSIIGSVTVMKSSCRWPSKLVVIPTLSFAASVDLAIIILSIRRLRRRKLIKKLDVSEQGFPEYDDDQSSITEGGSKLPKL
jgi:hypothetical protein